MAVRFSSGLHRGLRNHGLRPTAARTLEAVFSMLISEVAGRRVLDLYAGVGSYGIMALRRDAALAVFVDNHREALKRTRQAVVQFHLEERAVICRDDVGHFLRNTQRWEQPFHLIFADPPYAEIRPASVIQDIMDSGLLAEAGILVMEHSKRQAPPEHPSLKLRKSRILGDTTVSIWDHV